MAKLVCAALGKSGKACQAPPLTGSEFCYSHDPASAVKREKSRRKGGENSRKFVGLADVPEPKTPQDVKQTLARVFVATVRGEFDPRLANSIATLGRDLIKAMALTSAVESGLSELLDSLESGETDRKRRALPPMRHEGQEKEGSIIE